MKYLIRFIPIFLGLMLVSCMSSQILSTHSAIVDQDEVGTFDLIEYGMDTPHDVESVVILDRTGDAYQIVAANRLRTKRIVRNITVSEGKYSGSTSSLPIQAGSSNTSTLHRPE